MKPVCKTCAHWHPAYSAPGQGVAPVGECRRFPLPRDTDAAYGCGEYRPPGAPETTPAMIAAGLYEIERVFGITIGDRRMSAAWRAMWDAWQAAQETKS